MVTSSHPWSSWLSSFRRRWSCSWQDPRVCHAAISVSGLPSLSDRVVCDGKIVNERVTRWMIFNVAFSGKSAMSVKLRSRWKSWSSYWSLKSYGSESKSFSCTTSSSSESGFFFRHFLNIVFCNNDAQQYRYLVHIDNLSWEEKEKNVCSVLINLSYNSNRTLKVMHYHGIMAQLWVSVVRVYWITAVPLSHHNALSCIPYCLMNTMNKSIDSSIYTGYVLLKLCILSNY